MGDPWEGFEEHEQVVVSRDPASGTAMVVAIHSTVLGPALGGTRMALYADQPMPRAAAYADALRLSRAMTYKNALAGLPHGGGKAVIIAEPATKSRDLLHAYGRLVDSLGGRYVTAGDVGMSVTDMDVVGETCRWTTGRSPEHGGVGDSGILTAVGVFAGLRASTKFAWDTSDLNGRRVGVVGAGKVGGRLIGHLVEAGADVFATDPSLATRENVSAEYPTVQWFDNADDLIEEPLDILSPNAMGGFLTPDRAARITARVVCGAANNQLAEPGVDALLAERGVLYSPDFMVNCGGVIQVAEELVGGDLVRARIRTERVFDTTLRVLERASLTGLTPTAAAEREAEDIIAAAR